MFVPNTILYPVLLPLFRSVLQLSGLILCHRIPAVCTRAGSCRPGRSRRAVRRRDETRLKRISCVACSFSAMEKGSVLDPGFALSNDSDACTVDSFLSTSMSDIASHTFSACSDVRSTKAEKLLSRLCTTWSVWDENCEQSPERVDG